MSHPVWVLDPHGSPLQERYSLRLNHLSSPTKINSLKILEFRNEEKCKIVLVKKNKSMYKSVEVRDNIATF